MSPVRPALLVTVFLAVAVALVAAWLITRDDKPTASYDQRSISVIPYSGTQPYDRVELNEAEVASQVPSLREAFDEAKASGLGTVSKKDVSEVWAYLNAKRGSDSQAPLIARYGGTDYVLRIVVG